MTEAPKRIGICPIHKTWHRDPHETDWNYIRADLVEAAIKRALEGAAQACEDIRQRQIMGPMPERVCFDQEQTIRALDPAQFIEEEKE
jgi:hypothetical protein